MKPQFATDYPAVAAKFKAGDRVRVRKTAPLGHIRTPFYIQATSARSSASAALSRTRRSWRK